MESKQNFKCPACNGELERNFAYKSPIKNHTNVKCIDCKRGWTIAESFINDSIFKNCHKNASNNSFITLGDFENDGRND